MRVFVGFLAQMKVAWSFDTKIENAGKAKICVLQNGLVAIAWMAPGGTKIAFFTLQGRRIGTVDLQGKLVKWFPIATKAAETFLIVTNHAKRVIIVNCSSCRVLKTLDGAAFPHLVTASDDSRKMLLVSQANAKRVVEVKF
jgi:hypothetical protein